MPMDKNDTKINILIVSLNDTFSNKVAISLADRLDMFVVDCYQMIVYDLTNPKEVLEKCGIEYFKKRERSVIKHCGEFNNTVISISYDLFKDHIELFSKSIIFYLRLPEEKVEKVINKIDYKNRDENLKKIVSIIIENDKCLTTQSVNKITEKLGELYENC